MNTPAHEHDAQNRRKNAKMMRRAERGIGDSTGEAGSSLLSERCAWAIRRGYVDKPQKDKRAAQ